MPYRLLDLNATELAALPRDKTVFLYSVGPIEDHGPHLPLGLDLLKSEKQSELIAKKIEKEMKDWKAVLMPNVPLGVETNTSVYRIGVRAHVLRDWLVDSARDLSRMGFRFFVCFSGHSGPRQLTAIEEAGKILNRFSFFKKSKPLLISAQSGLVSAKEVLRSPFFLDPPEHGGKLDTSVALWIDANRVNHSFKSLPQHELDENHLSRFWNRMKGRTKSYWGHPADANSEVGSQKIESETNQIFTKLRPVLEGAPPRSIFRSWYSILPPNQSSFYAWIVLFMSMSLLLIWAFLTLRTLGF